MSENVIEHANPNVKHKTIGKRLPRIDAAERVTGEALYPADLRLPGMLFAKLKRSPHPHAKIISIDASKALALDGVFAVITADDLPEVPPGTQVPLGQLRYDTSMIAEVNMARHKVFWVGQPVAAVAATDEHIAEKALDLIHVTYGPLPAAMSMDDAMAPGAPVLHENLKTTGLDASPTKSSNICSRALIERGDVAQGFHQSAQTAEISVRVDTAHQGYIEPQAVVAQMDSNGFATVWASTQGHFTTEIMIAQILDLPQSKIKVIAMEMGGGFGGKIFIHGEAAAVKLSEVTGHPIKLVFTRDEVLQGGSGPTAALQSTTEIGADDDGTIAVIKQTMHIDAGGLPHMSPALLMQAAAALYQTPNLHLEGYDVVTNKPRTEAYRGPGGIQAAFGMEQAIDVLCQKLDICPIKFRLRNAAVTGSMMPIGTPFPPLNLKKILETVATHPCWTDPLGEGEFPRGRGLAIGYWRGTSMTSACHITIAGDGRPMVTMGAVDISGTRTAMAQVAAEQFQIALEDVFIVTGDTKSAAYSDPAAGSRVGRTMAAAVVDAAQNALTELKSRAASLLQFDAAKLTYDQGTFHTENTGGPSISIRDIMQTTLTQGAIVTKGTSTDLPLGVEVGAHVCDVEVDTETGQVTVLRYTAFQDVGLALNPIAVEGQIEGSVVQGIGWATTEGFDYGHDGQLRNATMLDYRIPTALDVPSIESVIIETPVPGVPYGLRGVGEVPIVPVAGCVANAVARAIGTRVTQMPMTPERVLGAINSVS